MLIEKGSRFDFIEVTGCTDITVTTLTVATCRFPFSVLLDDPYNLSWGLNYEVKVKAINAIGLFSESLPGNVLLPP